MIVCRTSPLAVLSAVAAALVASAAVSVPAYGPAAADPADDKKRADADVARASSILEGATDRARAAARRLDAVTVAIPPARQRVAESRGRVAASAAAANSARRAADRANAAVDRAGRRHARSQRAVVAARERVAAFVTATYKGGDIVTLNVLLGARTVQDITRRVGYVDRVLDAERESVDRLVTARGEARQAELGAELARRQAERARHKAEASLRAAETARQQAEAAASALLTLAAQRSQALKVAEEERAESLARYRRAKAEAARVEAELRAWEARQRGRDRGPDLRPGARLLMPVRGWKSSDFGMRFDPFFRVWQMHAGVDLAADGGEPIYAAAAGRVIRAGYHGGYGNLTCVSHGRYLGRGLSTCYAHQSRILVSPGQRVSRGQVIGRVGTTGASTGHHLHFEVRLDGSPVQPLSWLPHCLC